MLTQKQEDFTKYIFEGKTQREAWGLAGYSTKYPVKIQDENACRLAAESKIKARIQELREKAADDSIAGVKERKKILTEIARGNLLDYQEIGADGSYISIGKESPNTRAVSEITSRTEYDKDGANAALITKVKLHSPTQAIDILNKMDKIYTEGVIDNSQKTINIIVRNEEARDLLLAAKGRLQGSNERMGGKNDQRREAEALQGEEA